MRDLTKKHLKPIRVEPSVTVGRKEGGMGFAVALEVLLLYLGLLGYIFCNTTALDMGIPAWAVVLITALSFGLMILVVWYKRVFFSIAGGLAGLSLLTYKVSFPMFAGMWRALEVCYNYTIHLLATQPTYGSYVNYMTMDLDNILENPTVLTRYFYTAVILLSVIAALFFALALFRRVPIMVAFIVPGVGLVPLFFYGIVPHYIAFSVFLSALIGCYGQSIVQQMSRRRAKAPRVKKSRKERKVKVKKQRTYLTTRERFSFAAGHGSFGMVVAVVMLAITVGTAAFIYSRPILQMEQFRETLDTLSEDALNIVFRKTYEKQLNVAGYMEEGETLDLQVPSWRRLKVLTVTSQTGTPVYLRYRTTVQLNENGWTTGDQAFSEDLSQYVYYDFCEYTQYYNFLKLTAPGGDPLEAGLDNVESEEQGYITDQITVYPYYKASNLLGLPGGITGNIPLSDYERLERKNDTLLLSNDTPRDRSYMFRVTSPVLSSNIYLTNFDAALQSYFDIRNQYGENDPYMSREMEYSSFVYRHYMELPSEVKNTVAPLAREIVKPYTTKLQHVQAIERYFRNEFKYSTQKLKLTRSDGTAASAYDYINYFLFQNEKKEGYCTLFASSMVSMLRSIGYPARVVTGYYATPYYVGVDQYAVDIMDYNYHAWVEVYFDGMGWLSFEPTPGFGVERNYYLLELVDEGKELEAPTIEIEYDGIQEYNKYPKELPDPKEPEEEKDPLANLLNNNLQLGNWAKVILIIVRILLVILLLVAIIVATELMRRKSIERMLKASPAEGVRRGYYLILRLMQLRGFKFFEGELLEEFARRADNLELAELPLSPIVPVLQKALYSPLEVSEEERQAVAAYVQALNKSSFRYANIFKKFWYKWTLWKKPKHPQMIWSFK